MGPNGNYICDTSVVHQPSGNFMLDGVQVNPTTFHVNMTPAQFHAEVVKFGILTTTPANKYVPAAPCPKRQWEGKYNFTNGLSVRHTADKIEIVGPKGTVISDPNVISHNRGDYYLDGVQINPVHLRTDMAPNEFFRELGSLGIFKSTPNQNEVAEAQKSKKALKKLRKMNKKARKGKARKSRSFSRRR